jgi:hypothetical protein
MRPEEFDDLAALRLRAPGAEAETLLDVSPATGAARHLAGSLP